MGWFYLAFRGGSPAIDRRPTLMIQPTSGYSSEEKEATMKIGWIAAASGVALLMTASTLPSAAIGAANEQNFDLGTTRDLVVVRSVASDDLMYNQAKELWNERTT
jgi:hypothetical protein